MTNREIVDKVEGWNWNLNIFEIYDEVRYMNKADQHALLNHAYEYFNYESTMYELMSFLGVEVAEYSKADLTTAS